MQLLFRTSINFIDMDSTEFHFTCITVNDPLQIRRKHYLYVHCIQNIHLFRFSIILTTKIRNVVLNRDIFEL